MASLPGKTSIPYNTMSESHSQELFTKCCFCIPLRIACFIIGYLNLIGSCIYTVVVLYLTIFVGMASHGFNHFGSQEEFETLQHARPDVASAEKPFLTIIGALMIFLLLVNICWVIIGIACLVGVHKKKVKPLKVYIAFSIVRIVLGMIAVTYLITQQKTNVQSSAIHFFEFAASAYFVLVFHVYAKRLEREQNALKLAQINSSPNDVYLVTKVDKNTLVA